MQEVTDDPRVARVVQAAAEKGLDLRPVRFEKETRTAADAAAAIGCDVAQIVKSLVFVAGGTPVLFLVSGRNRLDPSLAGAAAGVATLDKADATAVKEATGYSIGATPPFGHVSDMRVFIDEDLLAFDEVWAAAGRVDSVFPISPASLAAATGAETAPLKQA